MEANYQMSTNYEEVEKSKTSQSRKHHKARGGAERVSEFERLTYWQQRGGGALAIKVAPTWTRADVEADVAVARQPPKKRTFKKFSLEASTWMPFLHAVSEPCRRSEKKTPLGHRSPASLTGIGVGHRYFAKNGVSVQPSCDLAGQISVAAGNASSTFGPSEQRIKVESETESVNPAGSIDIQKSSSPMTISPNSTGQAEEASLLTCHIK
ncbi:hypothetical protein SO802_020740 [Lithocarpus litseifolius]|uniref:Uncharacterized protein n=1 Tax=Lithocarpus litseifolius TaxID=425828 RepID=A0AAW2CCW6_9ROSI